MSQLGKAIQSFREKAGLTQGELGDLIEVSQQTIAKWEGGKSNPRPKALERLIDALKIDGRQLREMRISSTIDPFPYTPTEILAEMMLMDPEINNLRDMDREGDSSLLPREFPSQWKAGGIATDRALQEMLAPVVDAAEPTSRWGAMIHSQFGPLRVDYMNDELYAQFLHAKTPRGLAGVLSYNIYRNLWRYAMLERDPRSNKNYHLIIITFPEGQSLDREEASEHDRKVMGGNFPNERTLRRLTTEASMMGIYIVLARTPAQVVSSLTNPSSIYDLGWDYPGPEGYVEVE